jgi:hypothetical protein
MAIIAARTSSTVSSFLPLNPRILAISFMACQQLDRLSGLLALNPPVVKSLHKTGPCRTQKGDDIEHNNRLRDVSPPLFIVRLGIYLDADLQVPGIDQMEKLKMTIKVVSH